MRGSNFAHLAQPGTRCISQCKRHARPDHMHLLCRHGGQEGSRPNRFRRVQGSTVTRRGLGGLPLALHAVDLSWVLGRWKLAVSTPMADECLQQEGGPRHVVAQRIANTCQAWARVFDRPTLRPTFGCAPKANTYLDDAAFQPIDKGASPLGGSRTW